MTFTGALNSLMLILGPSIATYFAFEVAKREGGQRTATIAGLCNLGVQIAKLIILAMISPLLQSSTGNTETSSSIAFKWGQITLNALLSFTLETYALKYVF